MIDVYLVGRLSLPRISNVTINLTTKYEYTAEDRHFIDSILYSRMPK